MPNSPIKIGEKLIIGDTQYEIDKFYLQGVKDCRANICWYNNPYRDGSQRHYQWEYGYTNEESGYHEDLE